VNVTGIVVRLGGSSEAAEALHLAAVRFGIVRRDHWLAQMYVESQGFTKTRENLRYRPERLLEVFHGRNGLKTLDQAREIVAKGPSAIAEQVYGRPWGVRLGNVFHGDGADFRGRGYIQLTGRANYARCSLGIFGVLRLLSQPHWLERPEGAALSAGWYWHSKGCDRLGDDIVATTRRVNGGLNGLADRRRVLERIRSMA
jgi:putative chitinase